MRKARDFFYFICGIARAGPGRKFALGLRSKLLAEQKLQAFECQKIQNFAPTADPLGLPIYVLKYQVAAPYSN